LPYIVNMMIVQNTNDSINHALLNEYFIDACRDYSVLMNRHYPERGALKLVGDRYRLSRDQRTVLYRGISSAETSVFRKSLLVQEMRDEVVAVDGYNVLFTLLNYRLGRFTFIATDNVLRDAGSLHGRLRDERTFRECVILLMDFLASGQPSSVDIFLDSPVSHSEKHALAIRDMLKKWNLTGTCQTIRSADFALKNFQNGILATSDTVIIEKAVRPVVDLPRLILEKQYDADFIKISDLLALPGPD
jgi:hypothetical protein